MPSKRKASQRDWIGLAREVLDVEIEGLASVRETLGEGFLAALECMAGCAGRIVVTGIGKSGLVGRKIAATLSSLGTPSFFLHPVEGVHGDMGMVRREDVILAVSNSGETLEVNALVPSLKACGATVVALTANASSTLARLSNIVVPATVAREACPLGLAPTASTTAALAVGDALAICLMEWKGFGKEEFQRVHPGGSLGQRLALSVEAIMHTEDLPTASDAAPLQAALDALNRGRLGLVALLDAKGRLAGVLSDGDVRRLVCAGNLAPKLPAREAMTRTPRSVHPGASAAAVLDIMEERQITVLPVVKDDGALVGMIHLHDLLGKGRLKFALGPFPGERP